MLDAVLSMHHQAVETLAPGFEVSATAPDGVIEAFEDASPARWWLATQFHPEWSTQLHWVMGLFTSFVDASRAYSAVPRAEIEPLRPEIKEWLRTRDAGLSLRSIGTNEWNGGTSCFDATTGYTHIHLAAPHHGSSLDISCRKEYPVMSTSSAHQHVMDLLVARRVFNTCWFSASLGISILQMRLLAQAWQASQLALVPACLMSLWTLGSLIGMRLPKSSRVWGFATLAGALLWLGEPICCDVASLPERCTSVRTGYRCTGTAGDIPGSEQHRLADTAAKLARGR